MDEEQRKAIGDRNRRRAHKCPRCGSPNVVDRDNLDDEAHFPGVTYRTCYACGHEAVMKNRGKG